MRYSSSGTRVRISALLPVNISFTARFATLNHSKTFQTCTLQRLAYEVLEFRSASHSCAHYVTMFDQVHSKPPHMGMSGQKNHFLDFFTCFIILIYGVCTTFVNFLFGLIIYEFTITNHGFKEICIRVLIRKTYQDLVIENRRKFRFQKELKQ